MPTETQPDVRHPSTAQPDTGQLNQLDRGDFPTSPIPTVAGRGSGARPVRARRPEATTERLDHLTAAVLAAFLTAVLVLASTGGGLAAVIAVVAVLQALLIGGWVVALEPPGPIGAAVIACAAAVAADIVLAARDRPSLSALIGVLGLAFVALILHQLFRGPVRVKVTDSMARLATLVVVTGALAALVVTRRGTSGPDLLVAAVLAMGIALVVGHLVDLVVSVPRFADGIPRGLPALLIGAIGGGATAIWRLHHLSGVGTVEAGFLGVALGLVVGLVAVGVSYLELAPRGTAGRLAAPYLQVVLPIALAAPVAYLLSRVVAG